MAGGDAAATIDQDATQQQQQQSPQPSASPSPQPSSAGNLGPFGGTGFSTPVTGNTTSTDTTGVGTDAPADFVAAVVSKLKDMIGSKAYLASESDLEAIARKIWSTPSAQASWAYYLNNKTGSNLLGFDALIQNLVLNPGVDAQGNPTVDPTITTDYINLKQGTGTALSSSELSALANVTMAANATIPNPFGAQTKVSGFDFGAPEPKGGWSPKSPNQSYGWSNHMGVDYGTRAGDRIVSPFAGTVHVQNNVPGYGNYVTVTLDNGWTIGFGHVASGMATDGARVNPGDLIAIAGQNVGSAVGSVTIVTWQDPSGKYINPHDVLDPIQSGTTFLNLGAAGAAGTGAPSVNAALDREYPTIKRDFQQYFGTPPSPEDVYSILQHGNSPQQWTDYIRSMMSHIPGMTQGQAYDLRSIADSVSMQTTGHPSTDGIVSELFDQGITGQSSVKLWYDEFGNTGLDSKTYNSIYQANQKVMGNVFNDHSGFDPRIAKQQAAKIQSGEHGGGGYT